MCEQCEAATVDIGEVVPGFYLVRATRKGHLMLPGQYGLVEQNDPSFFWSSSMTPDPGDDSSDEAAARAYENDLDAVKELELEPAQGYRLVEAALRAGYQLAGTPNGEGFYSWLHRRCVELVRTYEEAHRER
jgi:hypothetical protein